jgi:hypothetical protein
MPTNWNASSQKFAALCYNRFLPQVQYTYSNAPEHLKLLSLRKRRDHNDALFLIQVYLGSKFCPSVLETVGLRVPTRHLRDFSLFYVCPTIKNCPSARCASAANDVCRDFDVFRNHNVSLEHILFWTGYCFYAIYLLDSLCTKIYFFFSFYYFMYVCRYLDIFHKKKQYLL